MNITYTNSYTNAVNSRLAFGELSPEWKSALRRRSVMLAVPLLLFLLYIAYSLHIGFIINGEYYPKASLVFNLVWSIPVCSFFAWVSYKSALGSHENAIRKSVKGFPTDYFGQTTVSFNSERVLVTAPWYESKYSWKMINSIKASNDFLFFCLGNHLVFSIPANALGSQLSEFTAQVENLMANSQQPLSAETKS